MVGLAVQLSVPVGARARAAVRALLLLHSSVASRLPGAVLTTGLVMSWTVILCTKASLVLPQPSVKFQIGRATCTVAQVASGVVVSLIRCMVGLAVQLSVAVGTRARAAVRALLLLHSSMASRLPGAVLTTGLVVSWTVILCTKASLVLPQPSVKFQVRTWT